MFAAKVDNLAVTFGAPSGRFIHVHAANRVNCHDDLPFHLPPISQGRGLENDDSRRKLTSAESRKQPRTSGGFTSSYGLNRSKPSEQHRWRPRCDLSASPSSSQIWCQRRRWPI